MDDAASKVPPATPPVFLISGGAGGLAKHLARVTLAQFPGCDPEIIVIASVIVILAQAITRWINHRPQVQQQLPVEMR